MNGPKQRDVVPGDVLEIFMDPETEQILEGHARVWDIQEEDESFFTLVVSFLEDPAYPHRKTIRKYRKLDCI